MHLAIVTPALRSRQVLSHPTSEQHELAEHMLIWRPYLDTQHLVGVIQRTLSRQP